MSRLLSQAAKYIIVGLSTNALGYLLYLLLTLALPPVASMFIAYASSAVASFLANKTYTFTYRGSLSKAGIRYIFVLCLGLVLNAAVLVIFALQLEFPHQLVQGAAIVIVAVFMFLASKYFVFGRPVSWPRQRETR